MKLAAVLELLNDKQFVALRIDSREVQKDDIFIAMRGKNTNGANFISQALANGAKAIIYEENSELDIIKKTDILYIPMADLAENLPLLAASYYKYPSKKLQIVGVTGTNGKSSTTHYIAQLLSSQNTTCAVMGTVGNGVYPNLETSALTTSDCCTIQDSLSKYLANTQHVAMEVSSHALAQGRFLETQIHTAVFTNLSQDHLDYHVNMQSYFAAKVKLFTEFGAKNCVVNLDDAYGLELLKLIPDSVKVYTYSLLNNNADIYLQEGVLYTPWGNGEFKTQLMGAFNYSNVIAALITSVLLGFDFNKLLLSVNNIKPVIGRMEVIKVTKAQPTVIVDYAHTPDALKQVLQALRAYKPEKLYCIFGCGGDRDRAKRPLMLQAVLENSDIAVITQDNPRTELPEQIVQDMLAGIVDTNNIHIELDRAKAIEDTILHAKQNDIVLIAGKGHEDYQIIGTVKYPFSDQLIAKAALQALHEGEQHVINM